MTHWFDFSRWKVIFMELMATYLSCDDLEWLAVGIQRRPESFRRSNPSIVLPFQFFWLWSKTCFSNVLQLTKYAKKTKNKRAYRSRNRKPCFGTRSKVA